jgi:glycosyltransferase involved in cell wall biosynthesis
MMQPDPIIAATLIVRDEARCIRRCLESVAPWVDLMVVLDTGSTDDTVAIARNAGAEVSELVWPNDFSQARNHVLALADADWNLVIDADEWILSGGALLRDWCRGPARLGQVCVHSEAEGSTAPVRSWITRLLPRDARYEGRVHEQVVSHLPRMPIEVHLGHDGYLDRQLDRKRNRNHPLLLRDLADRPNDPYIVYQLGKDAEMRGDMLHACDRYLESLQLTPPTANWRHELVLQAITALSKARRLDEALALADAEINAWPNSPDFFFVLGDMLLDQALADPVHAVGHWLPLASDAWAQCLVIGERPDLQGSVAGRGSHLAQHNLDLVRSQLALFSGQPPAS